MVLLGVWLGMGDVERERFVGPAPERSPLSSVSASSR